MSDQDMEKRIAILEEQMGTIKHLLGSNLAEKNWRQGVRMFADDPGFEEIVQFGREIREQENEVDAQ